MSRRKIQETREDVANAIEAALRPGEFISYKHSWDFMGGLHKAKAKLDRFLAVGEADRACELYEVFLAGCHEKAGEVDDSSGNLGMFFQDLFCGWIKARQAAGRDAAQTVREMVGWMDHDDYGFCYKIDGAVAAAMDQDGFALFRKHLEDRFESAFKTFAGRAPAPIFEYPAAVRMTADRLKAVYVARRLVLPYTTLCEKMLASPRDCQSIAELYKAMRRNAEAMAWAERGLKTAGERDWGNENSYGLDTLRRELLSKLGRKDDALQSAWAEFAKSPSSFQYKEFMRYVPQKERSQWHSKAMTAARSGELGQFIDLCVETRETDLLAERVDQASAADLERISHYVTEKAAAALQDGHAPLVAKLRCAMAMRIVDAGKSKYYDAAVEHLRSARDLYRQHGQEQAWQAIVARVRKDHARKYGFMASFEKIVAGAGPTVVESFESRAQRRWRQQTSG